MSLLDSNDLKEKQKLDKDLMIEDLVNALFSDQYYYNTDKWVELQSALLGMMARNKDYSAVATMMERASKREHFQLIEFICSHLNEKWGRDLWDSIKPLIASKDRDARYRGVWLHSFLAIEPSDYLNIIRCLGDEYQDVRLIAYHWMVENSEIVFNIMKEESINKELSYFYQAHQETIDMDFFQILVYTDPDYSREYKKALLFMAISKNLSIARIKEMIDVLDDQDTFDYFYSYLIE